MNKKLFLMMGAPGSGKSTWVKKQLTNADAYISRDEIRFSLLEPGDDYFAKENQVFSTFISMIVTALQDFCIDRIFVDASHLNEGSRKKLLDAIKLNMSLDKIEINVIWLRTTLDTCIKRNNNREGRALVPEDTIRSMYKAQTMPKAIEGIQKVYMVNEKTQNIDIILLGAEDENHFSY